MFSLAALLVTAACGSGSSGEAEEGADESASAEKHADGALVFADPGWESIQFHNSVAQIILENGYGYETDIMPGSTPATLQGLGEGDIDVYMEVWTDNVIEQYEALVESGDILELSVNFDDNEQGFYVPTYLIEGDPARGIEPAAPDLKSVHDLPQYWELFEDPEDASKGRIHGAIAGWEVDNVMQQKVETYGLAGTFNYFTPGSEAALATALVTAYDKREPWVGYNWSPTWMTGSYDLTLLEEPEYSEEAWEDGYASAFPPNRVTVAVNKDVQDHAPDVVDFLSQYETSSDLTAEALAYMEDNDASADETALWFMDEHEELWTAWVPEEVVDKVKAALQ